MDFAMPGGICHVITPSAPKKPPCQNESLPMGEHGKNLTVLEQTDGTPLAHRSCHFPDHSQATEITQHRLADQAIAPPESGKMVSSASEKGRLPVANMQLLSVSPGPKSELKSETALNSMSHDAFVSCIIQLIDSNDYDTLSKIHSELFIPGGKARCYYNNSTILIYAIEQDRPECVAALLDKNPGLRSLPITEAGLYPIHIAARDGKLDCLKKIIATGFSPFEQSERHGNTALHYACQQGQLRCIDYLIKHNAKIAYPINMDNEKAVQKILESKDPEKNLLYFIKQFPVLAKEFYHELLKHALGLNKKECVDGLLDQLSAPEINQLNSLDSFLSYAYLGIQYPDLYKKYHHRWTLPKQLLSGFNMEKSRAEFIRLNSTFSVQQRHPDSLPFIHNGNTKNQNQSFQIENVYAGLNYLSLAAVNQTWDCVQEARAFLAGAGHVEYFPILK